MKKIKFMLLVISLMITSILLPSLAAFGAEDDDDDADTGGDVIVSDGELQQGDAEALLDEKDPLVAYLEICSQGLALNPEAAAEFESWEDIIGLEWEFTLLTEEEEPPTVTFVLDENNNGRLVLQYQGVDYDEEDSAILVRLEPYEADSDDDNESDDAASDDGTSDDEAADDDEDEDGDEDGQEAEGPESLVFLYINRSRNPEELSLPPDEDGNIAARVVLLRPGEDDSEEEDIVLIPSNSLILYEDYEAAIFVPPPPPADPDEETPLISYNWEMLAGELQRAAPLDSLLNSFLSEFRDSDEALVLINLSYDRDSQTWSISNSQQNPVETFPTEFEVLDTSGNSIALIGLIVLMVVSVCALFVNILLATRKSRR